MDHDERWLRIESSHFRYLYIDEVYGQVLLGIGAGRRLIECAPEDMGSVLKVNRDIGIQAGQLISVAGRLQSLLYESPRAKNESRSRWELRRRRAQWLRESVFSDVDVSILNDRAVRNSIEHFDDRLDEIAARSLDDGYTYPLHVVSDVALGFDGILRFLEATRTPPQTTEYIRTYVADSQTFHVLRWSFSVAEVLRCLESMADCLQNEGWVEQRQEVDEHYGSIRVIGQGPLES